MKTEESNGIILSKETINRVAKEIVASQSFDFCSFTESKNKTSLKEFNCIYDRLIMEVDFCPVLCIPEVPVLQAFRGISHFVWYCKAVPDLS